MKDVVSRLGVVCVFAVIPSGLHGQAGTRVDSTMQWIHIQARDSSRVPEIAQPLMDSIGARLTGSAQAQQAVEWAIARYGAWGIPARAEQYGTWRGWHRGTIHIDLVAPNPRSLDGMLMTWSRGTAGSIEGPVVVFPNVQSAAEFESWLPQVRGKFLAIAFPEPTCRPDDNWKEFAAPESFERMQRERIAARDKWYSDMRRQGLRGRDLFARLEGAGALGILVSLSQPPGSVSGWGVGKIGTATAEQIPEIGLSCEDYGLVFRLAQNNQGPVLRVNSDARFIGDVPVYNVIAEIPGAEKPEEYVVLSAHLDSWDAASGATDNGSGIVVMMEAMRILRNVQPKPKRTVIAALWGGEEQGLNGSRAYVEDHPEIVAGLQVLLNQDNGTGRIASISMEGFTGAADHFRRWFASMPEEVTRDVALMDPGSPTGGTDHLSFLCHGVPSFNLSSIGWGYGVYTWHTDRDTYDKLVFDDLRSNAALIAMLAYAAADDTRLLPREPRVTATDAASSQPRPWPTCARPARSWAESGT